jgi:hypothetical protein
MATKACVGVEPRAEPVVVSAPDDLHIGKPLLAVVEEL